MKNYKNEKIESKEYAAKGKIIKFLSGEKIE